jgi:hypothetical protein
MKKVFIRGGAAVPLTDRDFIAQGGEGAVYGRGDLAFKIYSDPAKMVPEGKIRELAALDRPNILRPLDVLLDERDRPVGFTMKWVREAGPLCRLFTTAYRQRIGMTDAATRRLVDGMRDAVAAVHRAGCLMVDGNPYNYLVDRRDRTTPYLIDVDSYRTPGFPATAITPAVRDPLTDEFTEMTDWFAFAVVVCQLFVGIHPFKGSHPDFKKTDLKGRMKAGASLLNPRVTLPPAARSLDDIPPAYRDWFHAMFERRERSAPPETIGGAPSARKGRKSVHPVAGTDRLHIAPAATFDAPVLWHRMQAGVPVTATAAAVFVGGQRYAAKPGDELLLSPRKRLPVLARRENGFLRIQPAAGAPIPFPAVAAERLAVVENTLFALGEGRLTEIGLSETGKGPVASVRSAWPVLPHATELFPGVLFQNALGRPFLRLLQPQPAGPAACPEFPVPELAGYRIVDARAEGAVCGVVAHRDGRCDRFVFRLDGERNRYDARVETDVEPGTVNLVTLENGIAVAAGESGEWEIFAANPDRPDVRRVRCDAPLRLFREGTAVMGVAGKTVYRVQMAAGSGNG